jgi:dipeptidyl aminopeptidase/acylaminoacyl peptidase
MAFASTRSGSEEIWVANADGSHPLQMTRMGGPQCANPQWSPDGRTILFNSRQEGSADLYLLQPDTGALRRLTTGPSEEGEARWSRDGRSIYFGSNQSGTFQVWRMPAAGGPATQITRLGGLAATEAGDGFLYYSKDVGRPSSIWRMPIAGGDEEKVGDGLSYSLNYALGDRGLYFVSMLEAPDKGALEFVDLRTRTRTMLARLDKPFWWGMTLSPGERLVIFPIVDSAGSNLMVVDNVR